MALNNILPFSHLDDEEFALMLYELQNGPAHYDYDRLSQLLFNPLTSNLNRYLIRSEDTDPDAHVNIEIRCYVEDKFNEALQSQFVSENYFSIFHLNVRSLQNKLDDLTALLTSLDVKFSIVGITETWLQNSAHNVDINWYDFVFKNRSFKSGGGVGLYVSNDLNFKIREDIRVPNEEVMEPWFIEILRPQGKNIIVGIIYRPPNQGADIFVGNFNEILAKISRKNKICYLMGDFNLNLLNHQIHDATGQFLDGLYSCMFSSLITLPSRITSHSATLIDNIFTNYLDHHYRTAGLFLADISDHLPIFSICSDDISSLRPKENIFVRNKNEANTLNFLQQLKSTDWSQIPGYHDPKICYERFLSKFSQIYNTCFPLKKLKRKNQLRKPWLSKGLLKSVNVRTNYTSNIFLIHLLRKKRFIKSTGTN